MSILERVKRKIKAKLNRSKLIKKGVDRDLYLTRDKMFFWLSKRDDAYVDKCIKQTSLFEPHSTRLVHKLLRPGSVVLDIGSNIGYYSVIFSKIVGEQGRVLSFEPTNWFGEILNENLGENNCTNVEILKYGLSNKKQALKIFIGDSSATIHDPYSAEALSTEIISLFTLDEKIEELKIDKIDFIKIDVDGHEPAFLEGAMNSIRKYRPLILLEVSHTNYLEYGISAWDFYKKLKAEGFYIYEESELKEIATLNEFLRICGNFTHSANILLSYNKV